MLRGHSAENVAASTKKRVWGTTVGVVAFLLGIILASLSTSGQHEDKPSDPNGVKKRARSPEPVKIGRTENTFRLSPRRDSGGEPRGAETFAALQELGVRTIISVDGAAPDVEAARKLGIRYVHLPIGYDGIPREQAVRIIKAVRLMPGPVY